MKKSFATVTLLSTLHLLFLITACSNEEIGGDDLKNGKKASYLMDNINSSTNLKYKGLSRAATNELRNSGLADRVPSIEVPLLQVVHNRSREERIASLKTFVVEVIGATASFDVDSMARARKELLSEIIRSRIPPIQQDEIIAENAGNDLVADRLSSKIGTFSDSDYVDDQFLLVEDEDGTAISREEAFSIKVYRDANSFRFTRLAEDEDITNNRPIDFTNDEAIDEALRLIAQYDLVDANQREQLQYSRTSYTHFTGKTSDPGDRIVSASVVFERRIGDTPVLSSVGSQVRVELGRGKVVRSIYVDFPNLKRSTDRHAFVDAGRLEKRILGKLKSNAREITSGEFVPERLDVEMNDLTCGYMDRAAGRGGPEVLQLGCEFTLLVNGRIDPAVYTVPASVEPIAQDHWSDSWNTDALEAAADDPEIEINLYTRF